MYSETTWYAFDDTEFDNKEECEAYEKHTLDLMNSVIFLDEDLKPLENPSPTDIEDDAFYVVIEDPDKAQELFSYLYGYISFESPPMRYENDRYFYKHGDRFEFDVDEGSWVNLDAEYEKISAKIEKLNSIWKDGSPNETT